MFDFLLAIQLIVTSFIAGAALTVIGQWYLFNVYITNKPYVGPSSTPIGSSFELPKAILEEKECGKEPAGAVNALLQFLFQECRNTKRVRKWFIQKLSLELEELLTRTTTGKLFESIAVRDLNLGSHLPAIRSVQVKTLNVDSGTKLIDDVELCLDLEYSGGFQLSIDASMRLSKMAHVSVKVNELSGLARLKFSRVPYTHWNFSFYSDPNLSLSVESQFQGRALPQINNIIASQIRKALKKKHTLPFFKVRYKPFFVKSILDSLSEERAESPVGTLELTVLEATRITEAEGLIYCTVAIDSTVWIEMTHSGSSSYLTVDVTVPKVPGQQLGIHFKQEFVPDKYQVCVVVDSITNPNVSDPKVGDIVSLVDGKTVQSISSMSKFIKQAQNKVVLRVERKMKGFSGVENKTQDGFEQFGLRNRGTSGDKTDSDSSNPPSSSDSPAKRSISGSPDHGKCVPRWSVSSEPEMEMNYPQVFTSKDVPYSKVMHFNETFKIQVTPEHKYLNLSLWNRGSEKNSLLGHISIPVDSRSCPPTVGHHISIFSLLPPNPSLANKVSNSISNHPGFEPCFCFGDVLLSFSFTSSSSTSNSTTASTSTLAQPPTPVAPPPVTVTSAPPSNSWEILVPPSVFEHDFIPTHFEKVTQCGFCFKKIWLRDALQCQGCSMSCHKKCAVKAQAGPRCARTNARRPSIQPEIVTTSADESSSQGGRTLSTLLASVANRGLKRAGSATSLAPPGLDGSSAGSVSLPPSPNHSPSPSRKTSLVEEGLFSLSAYGDDEINQALESLLSRSHDEDIMDVAKASGKLLFADLPPDARKLRIDAMISKINDAIDIENSNRQALQKEEQSSEINSTEKAQIAFLAGKSEERLHALGILMLHCCAGLQDNQGSNSALQ